MSSIFRLFIFNFSGSVVNFNFHGAVGMIYYIYDIKLILSLWYPCNCQFNLLYDHLCTINCWPSI